MTRNTFMAAALAALGTATALPMVAHAQYYDDWGYTHDYGPRYSQEDYGYTHEDYGYGDDWMWDGGDDWYDDGLWADDDAMGVDYAKGYNPYGIGTDVFDDKWDTGLWDMGEYDAEDYPRRYRQDLRLHRRGVFNQRYGFETSALGSRGVKPSGDVDAASEWAERYDYYAYDPYNRFTDNYGPTRYNLYSPYRDSDGWYTDDRAARDNGGWFDW